mmetsp:Transcript_4580/g.5661  ORF Transcript_4580/g.5661 Transcript_4580/m.5661 type:complete len:300 (+) Transcript_4580:78-977(+)
MEKNDGVDEKIQGEGDNMKVKILAVSIFLDSATTEYEQGNYDKALKLLQKAKGRIEKLPHNHPSRKIVLESHEKVRNILGLSFYNRSDPFSFSVHYKLISKSTCPSHVYRNFSDLISLIRRKVFCNELNIPELIEQDEKDDDSVHILARIGDAPVAYARIWMNRIGTGQKTNIAVIDRFCTLKNYRCKGLGNGVLAQAKATLLNLNRTGVVSPPSSLIVIEIPVRITQIQRKLEQSGFTRLASVSSDAPVTYFDSHRHRHRINSVHLAKCLDGDKGAQVRDMEIAKHIAMEQQRMANQM